MYALDDPRRFNFGTPSQVWETMRRCWELEPTSERIIKDIEDLPRVLDIVIEHRGAVVLEECLRHGHRLAAINGARVLKRKVTNRQRKHLLQMGPAHRDARSALELLLGHQTTAEAPLNDQEILEAVLEEAGAILEIENVILEEHDDDEENPAELNLENIDYLISSGSHGI